jgi:hypothetical protein
MLHARHRANRGGGKLAPQSDPIKLNFIPQTRRAGLRQRKGPCKQRKPTVSFPMNDAQDLEASNQLLDMRSREL